MLNALRRGAKGFLAKILIGLLVLSFAVWGISDFVNQIDPTEVARAGDTPVSAAEYARIYRRTVNNTAQRTGRALTPQDAQMLGLPGQVLGELLSDALQLDAARELGVDIGDDALAERIREDPVFVGSDGNFDRLQFDFILSNNQYTEQEFIELQRAAAAQGMFVSALVGGLTAPTAYLEAYNRYLNQTRTVSYFTLNEDVIGPIADPDEATLRAYYDEHKADFQAPEYRGISTVSLSAEALADPDAVSADDVRRAYESDGAYGSPERRQVSQLSFDDFAGAQAAATSLIASGDFDGFIAEEGREGDVVDLGLVERDGLVDPAVADAAFALSEAGVVAVDGRFGPLLVRVSEIQPAGKEPLSAVEADIRGEIALEEAQDQVRDLYDNVEDAVAGGARVDEIASRFSLPTQVVGAVDRQGQGRDGAPITPTLDPSVLATLFRANEGDDAEPIEGRDAYTWVQLDSVTPAADRPFDEVFDDVLVAWTNAEKATRLDAKAAEALSAVEDGEDLETVATRYGADLVVTDPISQSAPASSLPQPAAEAAFEGPLNHTASVAVGDGEHVVLKVTEISEPAFFEEDADLEDAKVTFDRGLADVLVYEFANARQADVGVSVNQPVLDVVIGVAEPHQRRGMY
ncbi:MAG: SurA N-terminal domain-containing protein [Pseudomonadota bacterium]